MIFSTKEIGAFCFIVSFNGPLPQSQMSSEGLKNSISSPKLSLP